jgi:hypothetical protein
MGIWKALQTPFPRKYILGPMWIGSLSVLLATWGAIPVNWAFAAVCFLIAFVVTVAARL